jgi:hypothetical protein
MRKVIGYFEGTGSPLLAELVCEGHDTVPISNGFDNHGMNVRIINNENHVDVLVGCIHKIFAPEDSVSAGGVTYQDIFHVCKMFDIPLLLGVRRGLHDKARALFGDVPDVVQFVDPNDMLETVSGLLEDPPGDG